MSTADSTPSDIALLRATVRDRRLVKPEPETLRFAFVGRVSTEDFKQLQSAATSEDWQRDKAERVIAGHGTIVRGVFDQVSRTVPWLRRPNASILLDDIIQRRHDFDAIVVGETKRMFSGTQLEDIYHILESAGVQLWLPDIYRYDANNLSHRLLLSFEGILGRSESETVRNRVRDSMMSIAMNPADKRWLGGNAPFGYKLVELDPANTVSVSVKGFTNTLAIDEDKVEIVRGIFAAFIAGKSLRVIADDLQRRGIRSPTGKETWHTSTLSTMLTNLVYTGARIYGKQHKIHVPFDPSDRRLGTIVKKSRLEEVPQVCEGVIYPVIVSVADYLKVQDLLAAKRSRGLTEERTRKSATLIPLRGRVYCLGRKMEIDTIAKSGNVRFRLRGDRIANVPTITVPEKALEATAQQWFADTFSKREIPKIRERLTKRSPEVEREVQRLEARRAVLVRQTANLINAIEDSPDPALRDRYQARNRELMSVENDITALTRQDANAGAALEVFEVVGREMKDVLQHTRPELLAKLYDRLNLRLDYNAESKTVKVSISLAGGRTLPQPVGNVSTISGGGKDGAPGGAWTFPPTGDLFAMVEIVPLRLTS